jgi:hypothetical protein
MDLDLKPFMHPHLSLTPDGVSEFTFAGLYLFRNRYHYQVSRADKTLIIAGEKESPFFMTPCAVPELDVLEDLFKTHGFWKNISNSVLLPAREELEKRNIKIEEDRDNFDYLYLRSDLAELAGKKYHKKRNLVNSFTMSFQAREEKLRAASVPDALKVLDNWREDKGSDGDYEAAREALMLLEKLKLKGSIWYINNRPVAWCLGESLARGRNFAVHFEKGIDEYKGIYQYINQAFAASLPAYYSHLNREQDLGDEGLRQAKMTYRPIGFVEKYTGRKIA